MLKSLLFNSINRFKREAEGGILRDIQLSVNLLPGTASLLCRQPWAADWWDALLHSWREYLPSQSQPEQLLLCDLDLPLLYCFSRSLLAKWSSFLHTENSGRKIIFLYSKILCQHIICMHRTMSLQKHLSGQAKKNIYYLKLI